MMFKLFSKSWLIIIMVFICGNHRTLAQQSTSVQCGDIVSAEFTADSRVHLYEINLKPGDSLDVRAEQVGNGLLMSFELYDPNQNRLAFHFWSMGNPNQLNFTVPATGVYTVKAYADNESIGFYTLYFGCTLRDNTVINPGATLTPQPALTPSATSGNSILIPDLTTAATKPMIAGTPVVGAVDSASDQPIGYTLDANAGDIFALNFTRLSGNLNLGLAVMSPDNKVVFQASLVTSSELTTKLTLPSAGTYTIGVYRIDLMPPDAPEATAFQVQGTLNP